MKKKSLFENWLCDLAPPHRAQKRSRNYFYVSLTCHLHAETPFLISDLLTKICHIHSRETFWYHLAFHQQFLLQLIQHRFPNYAQFFWKRDSWVANKQKKLLFSVFIFVIFTSRYHIWDFIPIAFTNFTPKRHGKLANLLGSCFVLHISFFFVLKFPMVNAEKWCWFWILNQGKHVRRECNKPQFELFRSSGWD